MTTTLTAYSTTDTLLVPERIAQINNYLEACAQSGGFSGSVAIAQGERSAIAQSYGQANREHKVPNRPQTKFRIGSITKQFTATAILQLQERGSLNVHSPVSTYLPDYPQGDQITVHHLLTHTAGIPEYLNPESFPDFLDWMRLPTALDQLVERFKNLPLEFKPGERFKYSNSGYVLLTQIIETVSAQPYADYLQVSIFDPLGLYNTGYESPLAVVPNLAQGYLSLGGDAYLQASPFDLSIAQGAGGLYSTVEDLAEWNQWLYESVSDQTVLSRAARAMMLVPAARVDLEEHPDTFYGYGLALDTYLERQRIHHLGSISGFSSALAYYPERMLTVVVLSNLETAVTRKISEELAATILE
ncbi:MAG: serine hydrolase domain-containing protein [Phormidesmis sp.]